MREKEFLELVARIGANDPSLTEISFENLDKAQLAKLFTALKTNESLQEITISRSRIDNERFVELAGILKGKAALRKLDLNGNEINFEFNYGFEEEGCIALFSVLTKCPTLTELNLRGNRIGERGADAIAKALGERIPLKVLDLAGNGIRRWGAERIAESLNESSLEELDLTGNQIKDGVRTDGDKEITTGASKLAEALATNSSLTKLNLAANAIGAAGIKDLAESLTANTTLRDLDVSFNPIENGGVQALVTAFTKGTNLANFTLRRGTDTSSEGMHFRGSHLLFLDDVRKAMKSGPNHNLTGINLDGVHEEIPSATTATPSTVVDKLSSPKQPQRK